MTGRAYARYLPNFMPGNPTVIVRNMPGGEGTIGANYVYRSKPDGLTAMVAGASNLFLYITRTSAVQYDLQKMEAIVGTTGGNVVYAAAGIVDKVENLPKAKEIIAGHTFGSNGWLFVITVELLDLHPKKVVLSYVGGGETRRAFLSGEVNLSASPAQNYMAEMQPYVEKGQVQTLYQTGVFDDKGDLVRDANVPDIPTVKEVYERIHGKPPSGIAWEAYKGVLAAGNSYRYALLLPPGTPDNTVTTYWAAAEKMVKDAEFRKLAAAMAGATTPWFVGKTFSNSFKAGLMMDTKVIDWLKLKLKEYNIVVE
ncbi:MAG: hypothetical protein HYX90_09200 [Chloroflexi bacterium]|nr:hypothetical protein [Chloroflexota bacterium]